MGVGLAVGCGHLTHGLRARGSNGSRAWRTPCVRCGAMIAALMVVRVSSVSGGLQHAAEIARSAAGMRGGRSAGLIAPSDNGVVRAMRAQHRVSRWTQLPA